MPCISKQIALYDDHMFPFPGHPRAPNQVNFNELWPARVCSKLSMDLRAYLHPRCPLLFVAGMLPEVSNVPAHHSDRNVCEHHSQLYTLCAGTVPRAILWLGHHRCRYIEQLPVHGPLWGLHVLCELWQGILKPWTLSTYIKISSW